MSNLFKSNLPDALALQDVSVNSSNSSYPCCSRVSNTGGMPRTNPKLYCTKALGNNTNLCAPCFLKDATHSIWKLT